MIDRYIPQLSRRNVLMGLGATLPLPWLESIAWATEPVAKFRPRGPEEAPRRWACLLFANGVYPPDWWAKGAGADMQLSPILEPLKPHREDILVIKGMRIFDEKHGIHWAHFTPFLAGERARSGALVDVAESLDVYLGRTIGRHTAIPYMVTGTEPIGYGIRGGGSSIYWGTVSWTSDTTPVIPEIDPRQAFDRLFDSAGVMKDRSVLDAVLDQAKRVRGDLSKRDRDKLEEYMTSVRDVELRLERAAKDVRPADAWKPTLAKPGIERPAGIPADLDLHMKLMLDILLLAFQTDRTRIATFLFEGDGSGHNFSYVDGVTSGGSHHGISHHQEDPQKVTSYRAVSRYHVALFANLLQRMKQVDEGNGTLLDNCMLLFGSTMMDGNKHDTMEVPLVVAGRGGGTIDPGRVLSFEKTEDRRLCNLHLAMLNRMGVPDASFGNSHYPLPGLSV